MLVCTHYLIGQLQTGAGGGHEGTPTCAKDSDTIKMGTGSAAALAVASHVPSHTQQLRVSQIFFFVCVLDVKSKHATTTTTTKDTAAQPSNQKRDLKNGTTN